MSVGPAKSPLDLPRPGEEVEDGVFVVRRRLLFGGLAAAVAGLLCPGARSQAPQDDRNGGSPSSRPAHNARSAAETQPADPTTAAFDEFAALTSAEARALLQAATPDEEAYLARIAARLSALGPPPPDRRGKNDGARPWGFSNAAVAVIQFRLSPTKGFKLHDHRDYNGVLCGVSGDADCRNCDFVDVSDSRPASRPSVPDRKDATKLVPGQEFLIRETSRVTLKQGVVSTLSRTRSNLHEVMAGASGARLLDVFTYFKPGAGSHGLKTDWREVPSQKGVYRAAWA